MPELSRFYGIIIRMYMEAGGQHGQPHFHAYYQDDQAVYAIGTLQLLAGELPVRQQRLVEAWAEIHAEELSAAWNRLQTGQLPDKINPLQ